MADNNFKLAKLVISFNRHFYYIAIALCCLAVIGLQFIHNPVLSGLIVLGIALAIYFMVMSTIASFLLYDNSDLFKMQVWPDKCVPEQHQSAVLVHAGFDPSSKIIQSKYPSMNLAVLNFFDNEKLSEASIKRAHDYSSSQDQQAAVHPHHWGLPAKSQDIVFAFSSAHELRQRKDRAAFFAEAKRVLNDNGVIIVLEQLRNLPNFLCFGMAAFHFLSRRTWLQSFHDANLTMTKEFSVTPFMRVFVLN